MTRLLLYDPRKTQKRCVAALPDIKKPAAEVPPTACPRPKKSPTAKPFSPETLPPLHNPHDLFGPTRTLTRCPYCASLAIGTRGRRPRKKEHLAGYSCRHCRRHFTPRSRPLARGQYPDTQIIEGIILYCKGYSFADVAHRLCRAYGHKSLKASTIQRWVTDRRHLLSYLRVRDVAPRYARIERLVAKRRLSHRQTYDFHCHRKKLQLAVDRRIDPSLPEGFPVKAFAAFLSGLIERVPASPFNDRNTLRGSALKLPFIDPSTPVARKDNQAVHMAQLVVPTVGSNAMRHPRLQDFMIHADASTIAVEVPLWLDVTEIANLEAAHQITITQPGQPPQPITGHADILQVRNGRLHILDYKPNARLEEPFSQLTFYALALTVRVPSLSLDQITCAWFDETAYYEFQPAATPQAFGTPAASYSNST